MAAPPKFVQHTEPLQYAKGDIVSCRFALATAANARRFLQFLPARMTMPAWRSVVRRRGADPAAFGFSIMQHVIEATRDTPGFRRGFLLVTFLLAAAAVAADQPASREALWKKLEPFAQPP